MLELKSCNSIGGSGRAVLPLNKWNRKMATFPINSNIRTERQPKTDRTATEMSGCSVKNWAKDSKPR